MMRAIVLVLCLVSAGGIAAYTLYSRGGTNETVYTVPGRSSAPLPRSVEGPAPKRIDPDDRDAKRNLELALEKLRDAQQEQQDQDSDGEDESGQPETSPESAATPTPQSEEGNDTGQPSEPGTQATPNAGQGTDSLSPEQARQMLEALVGDSETLQERLQKVFVAPGRPPARDW